MNTAAAEIIHPFLSSQETLLWTGQPRQGLLFQTLDIMMLPLAAFWLAFLYVLFSDWWRAPSFSWTLLVELPVVAFGLYLAIGRFLVSRKQRACTFYAVTNERVLIVSGVFRRHLQSVNLAQLTEISMTQRTDGSGSITFGDRFPYAALFGGIAVPTMELYVATQFFRIPDVAHVCALIHDAQRQAWKSPSAAAG
jgi:hypothetical protein